jgi:hypothetical protein
MNRFVAIIAATAAAAAVAAAISLPAGADEQTSSSDAAFVSCLRSHGAAIPADAQGAAIKTWLIAHEQDPGVESALRACAPDKPNDGVAPEQLKSCLRDHGLEPPSAIEQLKPWIASQLETDAVKTALKACGFDTQPVVKGAGGAPDAAKLATCLRDNGASVPDGADGVALKTWLADHGDEAKVKDALKVCSVGFDGAKKPGACGGDVSPAPDGPAAKGPDTAKAPDTVTLQQ